MTLSPTANVMSTEQHVWHASVADWLAKQAVGDQDVRRAQLDHFAHCPLPTARDEDWKYTSLSALWTLKPVWAPVDTQVMASQLPLPDHVIRLVVINGYVDRAQSTPLDQLPDGLQIQIETSIANTDQSDAADTVAALALAGRSTMIRIHLAARVQLTTPIVIQQVTQKMSANAISVHVNIEQQSALTLIEISDGAEHGACFTHMHMQVADNAQLTHLLWQHLSDQAHAFGWRSVDLHRDARLCQRSLMSTGLLARQQLTVNILGENAESSVASAVLALNTQTQDIRTHVRHACMHAQSEQLHRVVVGGSANGVFHGDILVERGADKTNANMATNNLLISPQAQANSKPQLEIYADDVRCTHGVTSGQLDEAQIFYLRARGIPEAQARFMISAAFAQAAIAEVPVVEVADAWRTILQQQLASATS